MLIGYIDPWRRKVWLMVDRSSSSGAVINQHVKDCLSGLRRMAVAGSAIDQ